MLNLILLTFLFRGKFSTTFVEAIIDLLKSNAKSNDKPKKLLLPLETGTPAWAELFVKEWGKKCELRGKILFRLGYVVNEIVAATIELSQKLKIGENVELEVEPFTRHIVVKITFPSSIPLDPNFDLSEDYLEQFPGLKVESDIFWHHILMKWIDKATWSKSLNKRTITLIQYSRDVDEAGELYYLSMKPKLPENLKLSVLDDNYTIAKTPDMETAMRLGQKENFILNSIDGKTDIRDIYYDFVDKFGMTHPLTLGGLIEVLIQKGLIIPDEPLYTTRDRKSKFKRILNRIFKLRYTIPHANRFVESLNKRIGFLWSAKITYIYLFFIIASITYFVFKFPIIKDLFANYFSKKLLSNPGLWIGFYLGINFMIIIHEFSHAIVCKRFGGKVNQIGIMFYYATLCAYTDTTDAWMFKSKWHRILVSLAGPFSTLLIGCMFGWLWLIAMHFSMNSLSATFGAVFLVCILGAFFNLIPFIETDGYYVLMDIVGILNLRRKSFSYVSSIIKRIFKSSPIPKVQLKRAFLFIIFSISAVLTILILLLLLFRFIMNILTRSPGVFTWVIAALLVILFFERAIKAGVKWYKKTYLAPMDLKIDV